MKSILRRIKRFFRIIGALFYLIYYRIKYIGEETAVAQVVESFNNGGLEQVAANIYKTFDKGKKDVSYVISLGNNLGPMCNQMRSPKHVRIIYYDLAEMIKFCARKNIKTLIFHFTTYHMIFFKLVGFKNYYIIHNTYIWYTEKEWKGLKNKIKFTNGIIAVSEWCKDYFVKKTGIENIKVILNGIDLKNINNSEKSSITKKNLKIKDNEIVCLTVGSYTDGKHQMALIGIAEKVIEKNKNIKFVSAGPILDQKVYNEFLKKVNKSKASKNIIVLNYIPQEEMGSFISEVCDIYLQPSIHEAGVPLTVMEALLKGKVVIMTDFMLNKSFPNTNRIIGVKPPYDDILKVTPKMAHEMSLKTKDKSTLEFAKKICEVANNLDKYQDNFNINDYKFLSIERMKEDYRNYIR